MRLIPGKTKVQIELFKGVMLSDILVGGVAMAMVVLVLLSSLPGRVYFVIGILILAAGMLARMDTVPNYIYLLHILRHFGYTRRYWRMCDDKLLLARHAGTDKELSFNNLFKEQSEISPREQKRREKEERKARAREDKLLKSKKTAQAEKDAILARRAAEEEARTRLNTQSEASETAAPAEQMTESKPVEAAAVSSPETEQKPLSDDEILSAALGDTAAADTATKNAPDVPAETQESPAEPQAAKPAPTEETPAQQPSAEPEKPETRAERKARLKREKAEAKASAKKTVSPESREASQSFANIEQIIAFTGINDGYIEYDGKYFGAVLEIPAVEFRFFSPMRRKSAIEGGLGRVLRTINANYCANIVKIERPIIYDSYLKAEYARLRDLKTSYENGMLTEDEYRARVEVMYDRIYAVRDLCYDHKVIEPFYYLVLFESDKRQLATQVETAANTLRSAEMNPCRLGDRDLALFLKYTNQIDFDEHEIDRINREDYVRWAMPQSVNIKARTVEINHIITHNMRMVTYPTVVGDAWLASVMSMPGTKVVVKCRIMERAKALRGIDQSLQELRGQYMATGIDSKRVELQSHIETLGNLLSTLQQDNESLLEVNVYVTAYDIAATRASTAIVQPPKSERAVIANMKKTVRRYYQENGFRLNNMEFDQMQAFIGSQISGYDPMLRQSRGIPSNSLAACFPWIFAHVSDVGGIKLGSSSGVPVFIDFFRRDSERVNSNMVIVGKSGSGKSYATKSLLTNLAAEDCKIFILDPENEYTELAENLHGKFINVGNAQYGRLNPFQIITALDDDESDGTTVSGSYATHLQFLEEFFRQILPDCDRDAMEYLNSLIDRMYTNRGITAETDLSRLSPEDYPVFDDLYDAVLAEFQQTDNEYIRTILRTLMNYVAKFSTGGRNANIWNGPSTVTTDENFTVFNFQSLLSNRNSTIANAQMLLVLKYIDNEIIKNRDYNTRFNMHRKVVVVIDEAHVFIDTKFPVALDFMFQLAKRIRKYNGMQIVITQNIKDFVGSEEIARKSTAIINACQYSFIFSLAPNDIQDLCTLYEKAGGINEVEQEQITTAPRGQAFAVMSPSSRSTFKVEVPPDVAAMFQEHDFRSRYFSGEDGAAAWEQTVGDSRAKHEEKCRERRGQDKPAVEAAPRARVTFTETTDEEIARPKSTHVILEEIPDTPAPQMDTHEKGSEPMPESVPTAQEKVTFTETAPAQQESTVTFTETPSVLVQGGGSETMLAELLSRFSYDALAKEIQRTVDAAVEQRLREMQAAVPTVTPTPAQETVPAAAPPEDFRAIEPSEIESRIPAEETASAPEEPAHEEPVSAPAPIDIELEKPVDLVEFLQQNVGKIELPSPIDTMEMFGEKTVDITFDELIRYNRKKNKV